MSWSITRRILSITLAIWASPVRKSARLAPLRPGPGAVTVSAVLGVARPLAGAAAGLCSTAGAGSPALDTASARLVQTGQLKRAWR